MEEAMGRRSTRIPVREVPLDVDGILKQYDRERAVANGDMRISWRERMGLPEEAPRYIPPVGSGQYNSARSRKAARAAAKASQAKRSGKKARA